MKIKAFHAINFKGIRAVDIDDPDPTLVIITGPNGCGKTSLIDAIASTLGGAGESPDMPVRKGTPRAEVVLDLGDVVVSRRWAADGRTWLDVKNPDGTKPRSPQALLDSLYRRVAFDPVGFIRQPAKEQAKTLRTLAGLEGPFAELDARAKAAHEERAARARQARDLEGAVRRLPPESDFEGVPDDEPSMADLLDKYQAALDEQRQNAAIRGHAREAEKARARAVVDMGREHDRVERLRRELRDAEDAYAERVRDVHEAEESLIDARVQADGLTDPDVGAAKAAVEAAEEVAGLVRQKRARADAVAAWEAACDDVERLKGTLDAINAEKSARLSEATLPVPGLDVREDTVLLKNIPLSQVNSAEQIRIGLAVGAALNPGLKVALVRDGSLLDENSMAAVVAWAAETGFQVWCERCGNRDAPEGIVIEDGNLVATRPRANAPDLFDPARDDNPTFAPPMKLTAEPVAKSRAASDVHAETVRDAETLF